MSQSAQAAVPASMAEEAAAAHEAPGALEGRARRGALWVVLGYGGAQVIRLVGNLILTRLLFEEAFGVMALLSTVLIGLELFSDIGIGPSIIQNERDDARFVNTAWTMQVGRGFAIWLVACGLAVPFSWVYGEPQLAWLLPIVASTSILSGFNSTRLFTLNRELSMGRIEVTMIASQVAGLVAMVTWALLDRSVYALVAGALVTNLTRVVLSHTFLPGVRNRFAWDREAAVDLVRFGRWIFVSTFLTFFAGQADRLVFGTMVSLELLGVYYMGVVIAMLPSEALARLSQQIIFPVYSRVRERDGDFRDVFDQTRAPLLVLAGWAFSGLLAGGPTAVELLYDPRYEAAGWVVQLLSIGGWLLVVGCTYGAACLAVGQPKWVSAGSFGKVLGMAVLIPAGFFGGEALFEGGGFPGAVLGYSASEVVRTGVLMASAPRIGLTGWTADLRATGTVALVGGLGALLEHTMRDAGMHVVLRSAVIALAVSAAWAPMAWPHISRRLAARRARRAAS